MNLIDSFDFLRNNKGKPFGELRTEYHRRYPDYIHGDMRINKGGAGQFLEKLIGLDNTNSLTDFTDGELKTNKADSSGKPLETMFISQIAERFDELIADDMEFSNSWIYQKTKNLLYVPICKVNSDPDSWYIQSAYHVQLIESGELYQQLTEDFNTVKNKIIHDIDSGDGFIHTSNGELIQIRSKDSQPYRPIFSNTMGRDISNKNHAFYFKKEFMTKVQNLATQSQNTEVYRII